MQQAAAASSAVTLVGPRDLSPTARRFIGDWSDLADRWGVERTTAEILALLCVTPAPLDAASIAGALGLPHDEAERGLHSLTEMGAARKTAAGGSPHFECVGDMADMFRAIVDARLRREAEPLVASVRDALLRADDDPLCDARTRRRLEEMQSFLRDAIALYHQLSSMPPTHVRRLLRMGGKIRRALGLG